MLSTDAIRELLSVTRTIAVVGLSDNPGRASWSIASYMQRAGYKIYPVNPALRASVLGEQPYASLAELPEPVDMVNVFRRSEFVPEIVDEAIAIGAKAIWMQLGVIHQEAAARARAAGLQVVMDRCLAVDHRALMR